MGARGTMIFFAGIIQGSKTEKNVHSQDYRKKITDILDEYWKETRVYCPVTNHPESVEYTHEEATRIFNYHLEVIKTSDIIIAYVPEASMGTAIEIFHASSHGKYVVTISPLKHNWVVRIFSNANYDSIESFEEALQERKLQNAFTGFQNSKARKTTMTMSSEELRIFRENEYFKNKEE